MFNSFDVLNRDLPINTTVQNNHVEDAGKYEGKDNPGNPWYCKKQEKKKKNTKKGRPNPDHKVDVIA
ncbi:MAG: hypothetical protein JXR73_01675 [Candidatus Omnitrophica bacterium]|nr:hypothetical protein [Candidatus Omnitrophota bacterium]